MVRKIVVFLAAVLIITAGLNLAMSQDNVNVKLSAAVMNIKVKGFVGIPWLVLTDKVYKSVNNIDTFHMLSAEEAYKIFQDKKFKPLISNDNEYLIKAGKALGVDKIISGEVSQVNSQFVISLKLIDVKTGVVEKEYTKEFKDAEDLDRVLKILALKLTDKPILGEIFVDSNIKEAEIYCDEKPMGKTPFIINEIIIGEHKIELKKEGYRESEKTVSLDEDNLKANIKIDLKEKLPKADELNFEKIKEIWKIQDSGIKNNLNAIFAIDENIAWAIGDDGKIIHTEDGGKTWNLQESEVSESLLGVHFIDRLNGWVVGTKKTILKTQDGGRTWQKLSMEYKKANVILDVHFFNKEEGCIIGGGPRCVPPEQRGGILFKLIEPKGSPSRYYLPTLRYAIPGFIAYTNTGGEEFKIIESFDEYTVEALFFLNDKIGWAVGTRPFHPNKIYITKDGGKTWEVKDLPIKWAGRFSNSIQFLDELNGWIVVASYNTFVGTLGRGEIYYTNDGGYTLKLQYTTPEGSLINKIHFLDKNHGWLFGSRIVSATLLGVPTKFAPFILYTSDSGQNWKEIEFYQKGSPLGAYFINSECGWLVGRNGAIYKYENK